MNLSLISILTASLSIYIVYLNSNISTLEAKLNESKNKYIVQSTEVKSLQNSIEEQNNQISLLSSKNIISLQKLEEWKNKKPIIKYKVIQKIREVKSNECKDIKIITNHIRTIIYDEL